jgi:hypothetical protein
LLTASKLKERREDFELSEAKYPTPSLSISIFAELSRIVFSPISEPVTN